MDNQEQSFTVNEESTLLLRCKDTIESLHQQLGLLQINYQKCQIDRQQLKQSVKQKDELIKELKDKILRLQKNQLDIKEQTNRFKDANYKNISLAGQQQLIERLRMESDGNYQSSLGIDSLSYLESQMMSSKYPQSSINININDLFATDKRILICLVQQKDKEIKTLIQQNSKLKKQTNRLSRYCKDVIKKISSQYQIEPELINNGRTKRMTTPSENIKVSGSMSSRKSTSKSQSKKNLNRKKLLVNNSNKQAKIKQSQYAKSTQEIYYVAK